MLHGLDVSAVQGVVPWSQLTTDYHFVVIKAQQGNDGLDPYFFKNVAGAKAAGLITGGYHFAYPLPHLDPREQARMFFARCKEHGTNVGELPPFLDLEWPAVQDWAKWKCTAQQISDWARDCLGEMRKLYARFDEPFTAETEAGMTQPIAMLDGPLWPYLALILFAVLPTEIWRWLAVGFSRGLANDSPLLEWVRAVATALLAGIVAKLIVAPPGVLAAAPGWVRVAALVAAAAVMLVDKRRMMLAVLAGETVLIGGVWLFAA